MFRKKEVFKRSAWDSIRAATLPIAFTAVILAMIIAGLNNAEQANRDDARRILEESLGRAVVTGFTIEGRYPPSIAYIEEFFGVWVDRSRFAVYYRAEVPNSMPEIIVFDLDERRREMRDE